MTWPPPSGAIDYILIAYVLWGALWGLRSGFAMSVAALAAVVAGWIAAVTLTKPALAWANDRWGLSELLAEQLEKLLPASVTSNPVFNGVAIFDVLAAGLTGALIFLALFFAARMFMLAIGRALHFILDAGPLVGLNRLAGAIFGLLRNTAIAAISLGLLTAWPVLPPFAFISAVVEQSRYALLLQELFRRFSPL